MYMKQYFEDSRKIFRHYMTWTWKELGITPDSDNFAEWDFIFDNIEKDVRQIVKEEIEAAKNEIRGSCKT